MLAMTWVLFLNLVLVLECIIIIITYSSIIIITVIIELLLSVEKEWVK